MLALDGVVKIRHRSTVVKHLLRFQAEKVEQRRDKQSARSGRDPSAPDALLRSQTLTDLIMNKLEFKGEWHELKGRLRQKFAELTDNDLDYAEGQEEELLGHLQKKLGKSQQEINELINAP